MKKGLWIVFFTVGVIGCTVDAPQHGSTSSGPLGPVGRAVLRAVPPQSVENRAAKFDVAKESIDWARSLKSGLNLQNQDDFALIAVNKGIDAIDHVRLQQMYGGVKVWNCDVVVHASGSTFEGMDGNVLSLQGLDLKPTVASDAAMAQAKGEYARGASTKALSYSREQHELVVLPVENGLARLAWHVSFYTEEQAGIEPGLWHYFIDAHDSTMLRRFNGLHTTFEGSGPGGNAKVSRTWKDALDVEQVGTSYAMDTTRVETTDMKHGTSGQGTVVSSTSLMFSDPAINDAHGFAETTLNMLKDWFGYNSIDNAGFKIISRVHYSTSYENAFWDGTEMTYGDGASFFYPLSGALDVVAHEIDHGFTAKHSNLTYYGQSGGMNESFSDIAGTAAKFFGDPSRATFDLGGDIFKNPTGALRYMCDPPKDGSSIDNLSKYNDGLDVHYTSGIMNKAFCRASKRLSSGNPDGTATPDGVHQAAKAWYLANASYWTAGSTFVQGCQGTLDAAKALGYDATAMKAIQDSWADVGVVCGSSGPGPDGGTDGGVPSDGGGTDGGGKDGGGSDGGTPPGSCTHPICTSGGPLVSGCDPCVTKICASDSYCCTTAWDGICVNEVASICGQSCAPPPPMCTHPLCTPGEKLTSTCDPCVTKICAQDAYCCSTSWDRVCVNEVGTICGKPCGGNTCAHPICTVGAKLTSGCDPCVTKICAADAFCCNSSWDNVCVSEVASICNQKCQ
jgi:Zn-dependent metalloprotease